MRRRELALARRGDVDEPILESVAPVNFGNDLVFATEALAHRSAILLARYWIDGAATG